MTGGNIQPNNDKEFDDSDEDFDERSMEVESDIEELGPQSSARPSLPSWSPTWPTVVGSDSQLASSPPSSCRLLKGSSPLKKKRQVRASYIWNKHFRQPRDGEPTTRKGQTVWYCKSCGKAEYNTTNAKTHLLKHKILARPTASSTQQRIRTAFENQRPLTRSWFREALMRLVVRRRQPFSIVEWPEFTDLLLGLNSRVAPFLSASHNTVSSDMRISYRLHRETLAQKLSLAVSKVHFGIDGWTGPFRSAFMSVVVHWVDENFTRQQALLGMPQMRFKHSGEFQAPLLFNVLCDFGIERNLGYCIADNHGANDTCLRHLQTLLRKHDRTILFDPKERRLRCLGHSLNLAVQAFLFGKNKAALEAALAALEEDDQAGGERDITAALQSQLPSRYNAFDNSTCSFCPLYSVRSTALLMQTI